MELGGSTAWSDTTAEKVRKNRKMPLNHGMPRLRLLRRSYPVGRSAGVPPAGPVPLQSRPRLRHSLLAITAYIDYLFTVRQKLGCQRSSSNCNTSLMHTGPAGETPALRPPRTRKTTRGTRSTWAPADCSPLNAALDEASSLFSKTQSRHSVVQWIARRA